VAMASEKHMTENQSSELMTPRLSVGRAKAASRALGMTSMLYSGSNTSARNSMNSKGSSRNARGIRMCGADIQSRQRHRASRANGQVGHRNQGRSRNRLAMTPRDGQAIELVCQNSH